MFGALVGLIYPCEANHQLIGDKSIALKKNPLNKCTGLLAMKADARVPIVVIA